MKTETVVLCYPAEPVDVHRIESAFAGARIIHSNQRNIGNDIQEASIFCGHAKQQQIDWDAVVEQGKLRWIQSSAAGLDHCLAPSIIESNVVVSGCSGLFANQVAEQSLALLFAMIRRMPDFATAQAERQFERLPTDTLHGKTVGIVGFGGNGRRIATLLQHIAGQILATDLFPEFDPPSYVELLEASQQKYLLENSDVVIVTLPLTPETRKCLGAEQFSSMKMGSYFVNVARGAVVDQSALLTAIETGTVAFAGLDVVDPEPPPKGDPIWECDRVLISPHVGAQSQTRIPMTTELFCRNANRFRNGRLLLNQVDKQLQFPRPEHRIVLDANGTLDGKKLV